MMPAWRGRENASSEVFFTVPCAVTMNTNWFSSNSWIGSTAVMRSPSCSGSRFTIGLPREPRLACGNWWTLSQYSLPALEKHSSVSCVFATNSLSTKSSSLTVVAALPRPPRRCAWYSVTGCALA